tara:strand:- start:1602 stop:2225 length:624 start_codon:yes stop_codon:yes gene_type:complete
LERKLLYFVCNLPVRDVDNHAALPPPHSGLHQQGDMTMKTIFTKRLGLAVAVFAAAMLAMVPEANAWPVNRHHPGRSSGRTVQAWLASGGFASRTRTIRSFSHEPAALAPGDAVVITAENAGIMSGRTTLGVAEKGDRFIVKQVVGPWLGATVEVDGKKINGWVWSPHVEPDRTSSVETPAATSPPAQVAVECSPYRPYRTTRRYRR